MMEMKWTILLFIFVLTVSSHRIAKDIKIESDIPNHNGYVIKSQDSIDVFNKGIYDLKELYEKIDNSRKRLRTRSKERLSLLRRDLTDESTFSNINEVQTYHYDLDVDLDFDNNVIRGNQTLHIITKQFAVDKVILDIRDITINRVEDEYGNQLNFTIDSKSNPNLGQKLEIQITKKWIIYSKFVIRIQYVTSKEASAVTWLTKEQTAGKKLPYMYTQCESIHCRSIAPLQDTPAIKSTYNLHITSPIEIIARASGNVTHEFIDEEKRHTIFEMTIPVESYLLAFAGGNIIEHQLGPRTFVLTEPELMEKSIAELEDLEKAIEAAESYLTPYIWGPYKVLLLPPSFPYGGMENPLLTFANSALVSGDKSSFRLFVHELCHSWFGNLVTNENWSNFWLNEGFTVFAERKTDSILFGEDLSKVDAMNGNSSMYQQMLLFGLDNNYTSLHPELNGNHPDTSISGIPYEKGFQFLTYLESLVGNNLFKTFLQKYIQKYSASSIVVEEFKDFFVSYVYASFDRTNSTKILNQIDWDAWIHGPGLPPNTVDLDTSIYHQAVDVAHHYLNDFRLKK